MSHIENSSWFTTKRIDSNIFLTTENQFFEGNRANIWLIRGAQRDVIIDCGLGVCNLKEHLESTQLLAPDRPCTVLCTHAHFDHSGGAHHFQNSSDILIHQDDYDGLRRGRQVETLNYVKPAHFYQQPYAGFSSRDYSVPATRCEAIQDGHRIDLGVDEELIVMHVPGHTRGSVTCYYPKKRALFTGDFVYECGHGTNLLDWLPTSSVNEYLRSAHRMLDWLDLHEVDRIYPGHFRILHGKDRMTQLLEQYIEAKDNRTSKFAASCLGTLTSVFFRTGCFRCCPC